jgi:hypothetical protein
VLKYPDPTKVYYLETDFSKIGFGWVLSQEDAEGHQHPVLYGSRSLNRQEQNYSAFRGEFCCLYEACTKLRHYLIGSKFIVFTDHKPLSYMNTFKDSTGKMSQMMADLSQFGDFEIKYKPGKEMRTDPPSRIDWKSTSWQELEKSSGQVIAAINWTDLSEDSDSITERTVAALQGASVTSAPKGAVDNAPAPLHVEGVQYSIPTGATKLQPINWQQAQGEDADLLTLRGWLEEGVLPTRQEAKGLSPDLRVHLSNHDFYVLKEGILYRK